MKPLLRFPSAKAGFSLIEMIVVLVIIGLLLLVGLPNVLKHKSDAEIQQVIAKASQLNAAKVSYLAEKSRTTAESAWAPMTEDQRYTAVMPYLAFAPVDLGSFTPAGYTLQLGGLYTKTVIVRQADGTQITY